MNAQHVLYQLAPGTRQYAVHLPLFHQQEMHRPVGDNDKHSCKHRQTNHIIPQRQIVKTEGAENARSGHFDVKPVAVVFQT